MMIGFVSSSFSLFYIILYREGEENSINADKDMDIKLDLHQGGLGEFQH